MKWVVFGALFLCVNDLCVAREYQSISIFEAEKRALRSNKQLGGFSLQKDALEDHKWTVHSKFIPRIQYSWSKYQDQAEGVDPKTTRDRTTEVRLDGINPLRSYNQYAEVVTKKEDLQVKEEIWVEQIKKNIRGIYFDLQYLLNKSTQTKTQLESLKKIEQMNRQKYNSGLITSEDLSRSKVEVLTLESDLQSLEQEISVVELFLKRQMGEQGPVLWSTGLLDKVQLENKKSQQESLHLKQLQLQKSTMEHALWDTRSQYAPEFFLAYQDTRRGDQKNARILGGFSVKVPWEPLFSSRALTKNIEAKNLEIQQKDIDLKYQQEKSLGLLSAKVKKIQVHSDILLTLSRITETSSLQYKKGLRTLQDYYLDFRKQVAAENDLLRLKRELSMAVVEHVALVGRPDLFVEMLPKS